MNPDIRPQDDLFGHVNGRWLEETEIPSDRSSWGPFVQLADVAEEQVRVIIEDLAAAVPAKPAESGAHIHARVHYLDGQSAVLGKWGVERGDRGGRRRYKKQ